MKLPCGANIREGKEDKTDTIAIVGWRDVGSNSQRRKAWLMEREIEKQSASVNKCIFMDLESLQPLTLALLVCFAGCTSTIVPKQVTDNVPSWDGTNQTSGASFFLPDGSMAITMHALNRYLALVDKYGDRFTPKIKPGDTTGITMVGTNIVIDPQHLVYFATMNRWNKSGL